MIQEKLEELIKKMTLEEKIGQLVQIKGEIILMESKEISTGPYKNLNLPKEVYPNIGSILNLVESKNVKKVQDEYLSNNRLKIPLLFMNDIINGYKTILPIPLAQGCSWDEEIVYNCAKLSIEEARVAGVNVNFSPMIDLVRDARWGRVMESICGEDVLLSQKYTKAIIKAYQENKEEKTVACVKHFIGYGAVEAGRDYNTVDMSEREFRQYYLPAFKVAVDSGVQMIMTSFNIMNGIPCTINKKLLKDILRKEMGFKGIIISDYSAIEETINHGISKDKKEAAYNAITAGVDIDMMTNVYATNLEKLVEEKVISEKLIDEAVMRILNLKNQLGLFENPYGNANEQKENKIIMSEQSLQKARELTTETIVLLENKYNILPLNKNRNKKIALIGPYADNRELCGCWSIYAESSKVKTLKEVLQQRIQKERLLFAKGCDVLEQSELNKLLKLQGEEARELGNQDKYIEEAVEIAKQADIIILAIGEHYLQSGEASSRANIEIPKIQNELLKKLKKLNKKIITVVFNGRPLVLKEIAESTDALIEAWLPGTEGANAILDIIFGDVNPSGKIIMSFPQTSSQCPIYYNHYNTGRPHKNDEKFVSRYQDIPTESYYPFGYGLSYSKFTYSNLRLSSKKCSQNSDIEVSVTVKNNSNRKGKEVVQLYIQDLYASVVRPVKELKDFKKVSFEPYQEKQVTFKITDDMLKFYNENLEFIAEKGEFKVFIGTNSKDLLEETFEYVL